jgi:hypothetical protein
MIAQPYTFSITATGPTTAWTPDALPWVVVFASGGNGTVQLERSFDNGATWQPVYRRRGVGRRVASALRHPVPPQLHGLHVGTDHRELRPVTTATLNSTFLTVASGLLQCVVTVPIGTTTQQVGIPLMEADLLAAAQAAGRSDWTTADALSLLSTQLGQTVVAATPPT